MDGDRIKRSENKKVPESKDFPLDARRSDQCAGVALRDGFII